MDTPQLLLAVTSAGITSGGAFLLSLIMEYFPGASGWYEKLDATKKRLLMALLVATFAAGAMAISCFGILPVEGAVCTQTGVAQLVLTYLGVLGVGFGVNQGTYSITKKAHVD